MTSHGTAHGRFTRAIQTRNLWAAETAMSELGPVSLTDALDYLALLAAVRPNRFDRAAVRWHGRLETEAAVLTSCADCCGESAPQSSLATEETRFPSRALTISVGPEGLLRAGYAWRLNSGLLGVSGFATPERQPS